jgi:hypothetical protein
MAMTVTCAGVGTTPGAVYSPVLEIVPLALPPTTLQVTFWLKVSATVAVNCRVVPITTFTPVGATVTDMTRPAVPLLQPVAKITTHTTEISEYARLIEVPTREVDIYSSKRKLAITQKNKCSLDKNNFGGQKDACDPHNRPQAFPPVTGSQKIAGRGGIF